MTKTKSNRKSVMKSLKKTTEQALPVVNKGLTTVGKTVKNFS